MRRVLIALLFFTFAATPNFGQTKSHEPKASPNSSSEVRQPALRGIKLGMTADELLTIFHDSNDIKGQLAKANGFPKFGLVQLALEPADDATRERLKGTSACWITFFDGRINSIHLSYTSFPQGADWVNVDTLITKFSEAFALPDVSKWEADPNNSKAKLLQGSGFLVRVSIIGGGTIELQDTATDIQQLVRERSAAYHEEKRRAFKP